MGEADDKPVRNGAKALVKKDGLSSAKSNGVAKRDSDSHGHKKKEAAASSAARTIVKKSVTTTLSKVTSVKTEEKKKKVFTLPGQKHEPPEESDPCRIFYESLHEQNPDSEMAEVWMMEHGLLEASQAKKALERKQRSQNGSQMESVPPSRDVSSKSGTKAGSGSKSTLANGKAKTVVTEQNGKRKREYPSDDDDFIAKPVKRKLKS